jgi:hypothetical protein
MIDLSNIEFIHIPRTGGTTILSCLSKFDSVKFSVDKFHVTAQQMYAIDDNFLAKFSFAFCRNPFQRLVSIWQYELKRNLETKNKVFEFHDFNFWLQYHASNLDWGRSFMILPQWFWVSNWDDRCIVTEVFKFEDYASSVKALSKKINITIDVSVKLNSSMKQYDYKDISSLESKHLMLKLCKIDCEKFNYDW